MAEQDVTEEARQASIVRNPRSANPLVENGTAYEFADLRLPPSISTILVPEGVIYHVEEGRELSTIYLKKSLSYMGHPSSRMSIDEFIGSANVAAKIDGDTMKISPYGGWSSIEGGLSVAIAVAVPPEVSVGNFRPRKDRAGWHILMMAPDTDHGFERISGMNESEANNTVD